MSVDSKSALTKLTGPPASTLLFSFGLITDIQYADASDGRSGWGRRRYFRDALTKADRAVTAFNAIGSGTDTKSGSGSGGGCLFALDLGDLIDHKKAETALQTVLDRFKPLKCPIFHVIGKYVLPAACALDGNGLNPKLMRCALM